MTFGDIEGKVAEIVSEREIALNIGSDHGVRGGMKFAILAKTPMAIVDPDTGDNIGEVDRTKVEVRASEIHERFTIAETYIVETVTTGTGFDLTLFAPRRTVRRIQTLRTDSAGGPPPLPPEESFVQVGDRVREILEDDELEIEDLG